MNKGQSTGHKGKRIIGHSFHRRKIARSHISKNSSLVRESHSSKRKNKELFKKSKFYKNK